MSGVIIIIIIVAVAALIINGRIKRNKAIKELQGSNAYAVACIIMRELTPKGYVFYERTDFEKGKAVGSFIVYYDAKHDGNCYPIYGVGSIQFCKYPYVPDTAKSCDVHIKEIGLFVDKYDKYLSSVSDEIKSEFIGTAANVIKNYIEELKGRGVIISDFKIS